MRTFIFAIGGSGARVLRSLTMLLASGCHNTDVENEIIPIIVDYDTTNGDTLRTKELLELYRLLNKDAYLKIDKDKEQFFCTTLSMLKDIVDPAQLPMLDATSTFDLHLDATTQTNITFAQHINYAGMGEISNTRQTQQLLQSLYDTSPELGEDMKDNPRAELHMNLHKGFRGCPNLGCIVTKQLESSPEMALATETLIQPADRIVIVGSVFGGTGASGIPMLLDLFDKRDSTRAAKKAVIAVMPYFNVTPDTKSAIDSNTFIAKAKAAIDAYKTTVNNQTTNIYYIGDEPQNAFANKDGDREQKNNAHYVELVSAMCIMDFMTQNTGGAFECGVDNWSNAGLDITAFFKDETIIPYIHPLCRFKLFSTFCKNYLFAGKNEANDIWLNGIEKPKKCYAIGEPDCQTYRNNLEKFIKEFDLWIKELSDTQSHRPLTLFNDTADYTKVWAFKELIKRRTFLSDLKVEDSKFTKAMSENYKDINRGGQYPNRAPYVFWKGSKYTMDQIDKFINEEIKN